MDALYKLASPENLTDEEISDIYVMIKFQLKTCIEILGEEYESVGDNYGFKLKETQGIQINKMNEGQYLQMCENAKFFNEIDNKFKDFLYSRIAENELFITQLIKDSVLRYYLKDGSFSEQDKDKYQNFLIEDIKNSLNKDLIF